LLRNQVNSLFRAMGKKSKNKQSTSSTVEGDAEHKDDTTTADQSTGKKDKKDKKDKSKQLTRRSSVGHLENDGESSSSGEDTEESLSPLRRSHSKNPSASIPGSLARGASSKRVINSSSPDSPSFSGKYKLDEDENENWLWSFKSLLGIIVLAGAVIYFLNFFDARNNDQGGDGRNPFFNS
jgi:hypothetical protein